MILAIWDLSSYFVPINKSKGLWRNGSELRTSQPQPLNPEP